MFLGCQGSRADVIAWTILGLIWFQKRRWSKAQRCLKWVAQCHTLRLQLELRLDPALCSLTFFSVRGESKARGWFWLAVRGWWQKWGVGSCWLGVLRLLWKNQMPYWKTPSTQGYRALVWCKLHFFLSGFSNICQGFEMYSSSLEALSGSFPHFSYREGVASANWWCKITAHHSVSGHGCLLFSCINPMRTVATAGITRVLFSCVETDNL